MGHGQVQPVEHLVEVGAGRALPDAAQSDDEVEELPGRERHRPAAVRPEQQDGRAAQPVGLQRRGRPGPEHDDGRSGPAEPDLDVPLVALEGQIQRSGHRSDPAPGPETEEVFGDQPVHQRPQHVAFGLAPVLVGGEPEAPLSVEAMSRSWPVAALS